MSNKKPAQYKIIEHDLLEKIQTGYYIKGDLIPTELELSNTYHVSRVTVRKATDHLVSLGLLRRVAGSGTFVENHSLIQKQTDLIGFTEEMKKSGLASRTTVKSFAVTEANDKIAKILGIHENEKIYYFERMRYANEEIYMLEQTSMSVENFPDLSIQYLEGSKYDYVENVKGYQIDYTFHQSVPILPGNEIIKMFEIDKTTPILKICNTTFLTNGKVMDYTVQYMNSPKYQFNYIRRR